LHIQHRKSKKVVTNSTIHSAMSEFNFWKVDLSSAKALSQHKSVAEPPGYVPASSLKSVAPLHTGSSGTKVLDQTAKDRKEAALRQKAMDPAKQAGFMCFMLYMSGSSLSIFSIMMLVSCVHAPFASLAKVTKLFPHDGQVDVLVPRLIFCAIQLGQLLFAAHRLNGMGLLPTFASDWMSQMTAPQVTEIATGPA
jgi:ER membrane protein complex subunit 4